MTKPLTPLQRRWRDSQYRPDRNWDQTTQPLAGLGAQVGDYTSIAHRSVEDLRAQTHAFLAKHKITHIDIPHSIFRETYEHRAIGFRPWLEKQCCERGLDINADVLIIGPSVKDIASSERKIRDEKQDSPDSIRDYLREMMVVLKTKHTPKSRTKHGQSFAVLEKLITALENEKENRPYKNQLWHPHEETGYRGFKSRWTAKDADDPEMEILAEVKIEHEKQMDVDKLTRSFLSIVREGIRLQKEFKGNAGGRRTGITAHHAKKQIGFVNQLGIMLYERIHADAGFNDRFLDPVIAEQLGTPSFWQIEQFIENNLKLFTPFRQKDLIRRLENSGLFPKSSPYYTEPERHI